MKHHLKYGMSTNAVHAGETRFNEYSAITTPIVQASTFIFRNTKEIQRLPSGDKDRFEYAATVTPPSSAAEGKLATLEGAEDAVLFSSGMSALTTALYALAVGIERPQDINPRHRPAASGAVARTRPRAATDLSSRVYQWFLRTSSRRGLRTKGTGSAADSRAGSEPRCARRRARPGFLAWPWARQQCTDPSKCARPSSGRGRMMWVHDNGEVTSAALEARRRDRQALAGSTQPARITGALPEPVAAVTRP